MSDSDAIQVDACAPVWALVAAAGSGARMQAARPKQYLPLRGRPLLAHTLAALVHAPGLAGMLVVVAEGDTLWRDCVPPGVMPWSATGGEQRMSSVLNGLRALAGRAGDDDWVLVHDAARPCVSRADLAALMAAVRGHPVGGLLARPVADTLKRAVAGSTPPVAGETVSREGLWHALTPQVFRYALLRDCLSHAADAGRWATDESQAVEWAGYEPLLVAGSALNIKVTVPADLAWVERYLAAEEVGQ